MFCPAHIIRLRKVYLSHVLRNYAAPRKRAQPSADVIEAASADLSLTQSKAKPKARNTIRGSISNYPYARTPDPSNGFRRYTFTTTRPAQVLASGVHYYRPSVRTAYHTACLTRYLVACAGFGAVPYIRPNLSTNKRGRISEDRRRYCAELFFDMFRVQQNAFDDAVGRVHAVLFMALCS